MGYDYKSRKRSAEGGVSLSSCQPTTIHMLRTYNYPLGPPPVGQPHSVVNYRIVDDIDAGLTETRIGNTHSVFRGAEAVLHYIIRKRGPSG